jgi:hypothetical protein
MVSRSPGQAHLLDTAKRVLPGGILGGYDPPADLAFERGITRAAQKFYVSLVHGPAEVERTLEAIAGALAVVADRTGTARERLARVRRS